ncbi:Mu transposase C-terminal domain-containing protein [Uliginosibacterium flavum]|uniref:DDE-type integrase/transposase/recombinase n=1 Tax=Uliginosibacterium flavum TaxID=1396831 RepID=A0ABV2TNQ2_9RHOO
MHFSLRPDSILRLDGGYYRVIETTVAKAMLRSAKQGDLREFLLEDLLASYEAGRLIFTDLLNFPDEDVEALQPKCERSLADFPEKLRNKAILKWKYLSAICPQGINPFSRNELKEALKGVARNYGPTEVPPAIATFYRWLRVWNSSRCDVRALVDRSDLKGRKPKNYPARLVELINEAIQKVYLTPQRETKKEVHDWLLAQINRENIKRPPNEALPRVTMKVVNRVLGQYDRYVVLKKRYGARVAQQMLSLFGQGPRCERPLQRVEVDNTPLDILVIDDITRLVLGRPWITVMIDHYSRMVVGFHISFRRPSVESVLRCLRHALLPKTYVRGRFPAVQGEWPCYGLIELLVCDNGLEFHAKDLEAACADIGTHLIFCEPRAPFLKGVIERFLKTLNYGLLHSMPGTTFAKYDKRLDYASVAKAVLTFSELQDVIHRWIIDIYGGSFHHGIDNCPLQLWSQGVTAHPPMLAPNANELNIYLGTVETRQLDKDGIQISNLNYVSDALRAIRGDHKSVKVTVRSNPDDLGVVHVLDPVRKEYVEARCSHYEYANGLSIEQHQLIGKKARADYAQLPYYDAMLAAKLALREFTDSLLEGRRSKGKKKDQQKDVAVLQQHAENPKSKARRFDIPSVVKSDDTHSLPDQMEKWFEDFEAPAFLIERLGKAPANLTNHQHA